MDCAICNNKHTFDKCPILNDIPYSKKHSISFCLQMNKTQKQMIAAICGIDATWGTNINNNTTTTTNNNNNDDDDDDVDEDYLHPNTDNDVDFQKKEE